MQIIKDKQLVENSWTYVADGEALTEGDITVSLNRWLTEKAQLQSRQGKVGIRLESDTDINVLAGDIEKLPLIELDFPVFTDGRAFSHARLLRDSLGYQGEIRAVGKFMADQAFYLSRVGVNSFAMDNANDLTVALSTLNDFSVTYQVSTN